MTVRLVVVTGYLGSGKTTLLTTLKDSPIGPSCHFIVNEAGEVALDQASYKLVEERAAVVAGGCACCVRKDELIAAIRGIVDGRTMAASDDKDVYIIVETSGLANPAPIVFSITSDPYLRHHVQVAGVVCVLGAVEAEDTLARYEPVAAQLAMADVVVVSKTDRVDVANLARVEDRAQRLAVGAVGFRSGAEPPDWTTIIAALNTGRRVSAHPVSAASAQARMADVKGLAETVHGGMTSCVLHFDGTLDWVAFGVWLSALLADRGESIVRVKGVIPVIDSHRRRFFVLINGVQHIIYPPQHINDDAELPAAPALVFIMKNIAADTIARSLECFQRKHVDDNRLRVVRFDSGATML